MTTVRAALVSVLVFLVSVIPALADDWTAVQLRGAVLQLVDGQWQKLERGMVVPDSRVVRTLATGHVTFTRGEETVDLGANTQIQIYDEAGAKPFTTVKQYFGTVSVEAEVRNVQHFAVQTSYLAAVVKGTRFTVHADKTGASVDVRRGHVLVEDPHDKSHVTLSVGQSAKVDKVKTEGTISVSGRGHLPKVLGTNGKPLVDKAAKDAQKAADKAAKDAQKAADKAAKDAQKAADKAAKDAGKAAPNGGPGHGGGGGQNGDSGGHGNSGPGGDQGNSGKSQGKAKGKSHGHG